MEESQSTEKNRKNSSPPRWGPPKKRVTISFEEKLRAVKLHLEEGCD